MRIVVGGISHESNTFNPMPTKLDSFKIIEGEELFRFEPARTLKKIGVEVIPTLYARALPSGVVDGEAYTTMRDEILHRVDEEMSKGGVDGVCLVLHGAMTVEGIGCGELDLLRAIREITGYEVPISASFDLHGNIPTEMLNEINIMTAYRTTPHTDVSQTRIKAAKLLVEAVRTGRRPRPALVKPPILLPGEYVITDIEPAKGLYEMLSAIDSEPGIMDSSLFVGMAWADVPHASATAIAIAEKEAGEDLDKAWNGAYQIARAYWERRRELQLEVEAYPPEEAVRIAKASRERPTFISDSGDNITAGAGGDVPIIAEELISAGVKDAVVGCIIDEEAVRLCRKAGVGAELRLRIGGKLDEINGYPLNVKGRVMGITGEGAVLRVDGVDIILTEGRMAFVTPEDFERFGIDPKERKIVAVKLGLLTAELKRIAARSIMALTPGFTNLIMKRLNYKNLRRPIFPLDEDLEWS